MLLLVDSSAITLHTKMILLSDTDSVLLDGLHLQVLLQNNHRIDRGVLAPVYFYHIFFCVGKVGFVGYFSHYVVLVLLGRVYNEYISLAFET